MTELSRKALAGLLKFQLSLGVFLFLPAWSLRFWQAWVYWGVFSAWGLAITSYFLKTDPRLIERRLEVGPAAEPTRSQRTIQAVASVLCVALFVIPGLDRRLGWSSLPPAVVLAADGLVFAAFLMVFLVFLKNRHAAGVVKVEEGQSVISTGPYRLVRHPMYAGSALLFLATPFALGSPWALLAAVPLCGVIVARLLDEERFLATNLPGYEAYRKKVRYRLIPLLW